MFDVGVDQSFFNLLLSRTDLVFNIQITNITTGSLFYTKRDVNVRAVKPVLADPSDVRVDIVFPDLNVVTFEFGVPNPDTSIYRFSFEPSTPAVPPPTVTPPPNTPGGGGSAPSDTTNATTPAATRRRRRRLNWRYVFLHYCCYLSCWQPYTTYKIEDERSKQKRHVYFVRARSHNFFTHTHTTALLFAGSRWLRRAGSFLSKQGLCGCRRHRID